MSDLSNSVYGLDTKLLRVVGQMIKRCIFATPAWLVSSPSTTLRQIGDIRDGKLFISQRFPLHLYIIYLYIIYTWDIPIYPISTSANQCIRYYYVDSGRIQKPFTTSAKTSPVSAFIRWAFFNPIETYESNMSNWKHCPHRGEHINNYIMQTAAGIHI